MKRDPAAYLFCLVLVALFSCQGNRGANTQAGTSQVANSCAMPEDKRTAERLRRFDSLDFQFYSNQVWDSLAISHDADIKVYYPDGTVTSGLFPQHIDMLKPMFVFAPDTRITSHPVKFGTGEWTAVIGEMEGTFSKPMPAGGKMIPPTGKKFKLSMCTIGHWKGGKMIEEYLFWDNQAFMKQIGLGN